MKTLVIHSEFGVLRGGGENFTRNLFTAFAARGHQVSVTFVADRAGRYPISVPDVVEAIPLCGRWSRNLGKPTLSAIRRRLASNSRLKQIWDRIQEGISWRLIDLHALRFQRRVERDFANRWSEFDAVYVHGDTRLAAEISRHLPTVLRLPGPVSPELRSLLHTVHAVCANGDALIRLREILGDQATELPVGINSDLFSPGPSFIRSKLGWSDEHFVLGYVGRLAYIKGVDLLAEAFRQLASKCPQARLLILGSGEEEHSIRSQIQGEIARGRAHMAGDVDHDRLGEWYRSMNLLVMPSRYENFSNSVLEALACGVPFLGANVGGNRMMADRGVGWTFEVGSASSLAAKVEEITRDRAELEARGILARQWVQSHHLWSVAAERLEQVFARLVNRCSTTAHQCASRHKRQAPSV